MNKKNEPSKNKRETGPHAVGKIAGNTGRTMPPWWIAALGGGLIILFAAIYVFHRPGSGKIEGPPPLPTPKPGDIQVTETFDNVYQWTTGTRMGSSVIESNGHLTVQTSNANTFMTVAFLSMWGTGDNSIYLAGGQPAWLQLGNVDMTFEATIERNTGTATFGAACRYQNDQNFYSFIMDGSGYYGIGRTLSGRNLLLTKGSTSATHSIQEINKIHIVCSGSQLQLAINGTPVAAVTDATLKKGIIALIVGAGSSPGLPRVMVNFDNLVIKAP